MNSPLEFPVDNKHRKLALKLVVIVAASFAFGFALVLQTLSWWVFWGRRGVQVRSSASGPSRGEPTPP